MSVFDLFRWGGKALDGRKNQDLRWGEFSDTVKVNIIGFLDNDSLTNLTKAFPSSRQLVEDNLGIKVVIPARNWNVTGAFSRLLPFQNMPKQICDNFIAKLISETEGKKIRDLEMNEMPGACKRFVFDKFIAYRKHLKHVKLKYCDIVLVNDVLTKCRSMVSFRYETGIYRKLPTGPLGMLITHAKFSPGAIPTFGNAFISKIDTFQNNAFHLNNLKEISLSMEFMLQSYFTDWHNGIYIFLALPALPSVTKFNFQFSPKTSELTWKTHLLILACLADFLIKLPNLTHFQYHSTFNTTDPTADQLQLNNWKMEMLSGLIVKFGSNHLKQMDATASNGPGLIALFQDSLRQTMNLAAGSLQRLESLDLKLGEAKEHLVFKDFILHSHARVTNVCVTDLSSAIHEPDITRGNVYKVFALPHQNPVRLPMVDSITILSIHCEKALLQRTSLTRVLEGLPQLIEVEFKGPSDAAASFLDLEDRPANPGIFRRLEKLSVENICLEFEVPQAQNSRQSSVLCRLRNLKELRVVSSFITRGILVVDVLDILGNLRKLNKVHVKPMLTFPFRQLPQIGRGFEILERIGQVTQCGPDLTDINGHRASVYDFVLNEFQLLTN